MLDLILLINRAIAPIADTGVGFYQSFYRRPLVLISAQVFVKPLPLRLVTKVISYEQGIRDH